jgi:hypothetical protein
VLMQILKHAVLVRARSLQFGFMLITFVCLNLRQADGQIIQITGLFDAPNTDCTTECESLCDDVVSCDCRSKGSSDWSLEVVFPGWLPWTSGTQTVKSQSVKINSDPIQTIEHLDRMPVMTYLEARKGKISFYTDLVYCGVDYTQSSITSRPNQTISEASGLDIETIITEFGVTYQIDEWHHGCTKTGVDVTLGARYWRQDAAVKLELEDDLRLGRLRAEKDFVVAREADVDWLDPVVGARLRRDLGHGDRLVARGDVGGFGLGSKFSWCLTSTYNFAMYQRKRSSVSGHLGYRLLSVDYSAGSGWAAYQSRLFIHGPVIGIQATY